MNLKLLNTLRLIEKKLRNKEKRYLKYIEIFKMLITLLNKRR